MLRFASLLAFALVAAQPLMPVSARQPAASPVARASLIEVERSPSCGCCLKWVEHLRDAGFRVNVRERDDMQAVKRAAGVPEDKRSCHTARVGGYFIEGHVPAADIARLLQDKPVALGLAVPGMPLGSPGMETASGTVQAYTVDLIGRDGSARAFSRHGE